MRGRFISVPPIQGQVHPFLQIKTSYLGSSFFDSKLNIEENLIPIRYFHLVRVSV